LKMLQFLTSKFGPSCRYACSGLLSDNRVRVKVRSDRTWRGAVQCGAMRRRAKKMAANFDFPRGTHGVNILNEISVLSLGGVGRREAAPSPV